MSVPLKYAIVERERRYLMDSMPGGVVGIREIVDHYLIGTRLRLREVTEDDGSVTRKLTHKVRLHGDPTAVACTNAYLDEAEWELLASLPARTVRKQRHVVVRGEWRLVIDRHADGTLVAEIDDGEGEPRGVPSWLDVRREITLEKPWTGAGVAERADPS